MKHVPCLFAFAALLVLAGCSTTSGTSSGDRDVITMEQIEEISGSSRTAYQVVERLQPMWLEKRSRSFGTERSSASGGAMVADGTGDIVVYLDNQRLGGPEVLRDLSADVIAEIRYLGPAEATRFGTGHQHGAILVTMR